MDKNDVRISVIMPAFNAEKYIGEAIDSVLQQTFSNFELIVIDDGSTDKTLEIISSVSDPRMVIIKHTGNRGISAALNTGLLSAKADYIARFDADDICFPERLAIQADFLDANTDYILVGSDAEYISETGEHLFDFRCIGHSNQQIGQRIHIYCPFIHSSVMFRKKFVLMAGGYSLYAHSFEDYFLWVRLHRYGKFCNLSQPLIKVRFNPFSSTIDERRRGRLFKKMKREIILRGSITKEEGSILLQIINSQNVKRVKESAYHSLCGKKYLFNNHQPKKARASLSKAIRIQPLRLDNYALYCLSYLPGELVVLLHKMVGPIITSL